MLVWKTRCVLSACDYQWMLESREWRRLRSIPVSPAGLQQPAGHQPLITSPTSVLINFQHTNVWKLQEASHRLLSPLINSLNHPKVGRIRFLLTNTSVSPNHRGNVPFPQTPRNKREEFKGKENVWSHLHTDETRSLKKSNQCENTETNFFKSSKKHSWLPTLSDVKQETSELTPPPLGYCCYACQSRHSN